MFEFAEAALQRGYCKDYLLVISNLAFFISAYFSYLYISRNNIKSKFIQILPILIVFIGIGSVMFHTDQNLITLLLDIVPLYLFIFYSMFLILKELTKTKYLQMLFLLMCFIILIMTPYIIPVAFLNNSIRYIIILIFGSLLGFYVFRKYQNIGSLILLVISVFGISIFLRSIDHITCSMFSFGTHSYWHIGVAVTAFLLAKLLVNLQTAKPRYYKPKHV